MLEQVLGKFISYKSTTSATKMLPESHHPPTTSLFWHCKNMKNLAICSVNFVELSLYKIEEHLIGKLKEISWFAKVRKLKV